MNDTSSAAVSIIIPTRNEASFIERCLESVFSMESLPDGFEVIVVDGMSTDGTRDILADWCKRRGNLRVLDNPMAIVPSGMNIGIRAARGKWIIRLDAHSEYPPDYVARCLAVSQRSSAENVGGAVIAVILDRSFQGNLVRALTTHWFGVGNSAPRTSDREGWADTVPFGCYRREVFARIGLYDERLVRNQDYELNRRLIKAGGRIWYDPAIRIFYYNRDSLRGLFRQAFGTGQWNPWMWFVAPYSFAWRHVVPALFAAALIFAAFVFPISPWLTGTILSLILVPYLLLAVTASAQQVRRYGVNTSFCLPGFFFAYHFIYGLGSLCGVCLLLTGRSPVQTRLPASPATLQGRNFQN